MRLLYVNCECRMPIHRDLFIIFIVKKVINLIVNNCIDLIIVFDVATQ